MQLLLPGIHTRVPDPALAADGAHAHLSEHLPSHVFNVFMPLVDGDAWPHEKPGAHKVDKKQDQPSLKTSSAKEMSIRPNVKVLGRREDGANQ